MLWVQYHLDSFKFKMLKDSKIKITFKSLLIIWKYFSVLCFVFSFKFILLLIKTYSLVILNYQMSCKKLHLINHKGLLLLTEEMIIPLNNVKDIKMKNLSYKINLHHDLVDNLNKSQDQIDIIDIMQQEIKLENQ